jgi:LVIVD repeat-containing protein
MTRRCKTLTAMCVVALAMSNGTALAHDPTPPGTQLMSPFGELFWFVANFQTAQNPFNPANTRVTSSDIAFWGDLAYVGDYGGFRIFDISQPTPTLVSDARCYGPQGDPSVFDRDRDGDADTLVLSVDSVLAGPDCGAAPVGKSAITGLYPDGAWEGLRIFDVSNPADPQQIATVYQDCGSHTNTLLPAPGGESMYVLNSSYPLGEGPTCGPLGAAQGRKVNHGVVQVVEVPLSEPTAAREIAELRVVYPGDADGTYRPVSEHGLTAPLDDFLGCHDLSVFPARGIVGAACGEQAQVWDIDKKTGLPGTASPRWAYDQPNVDFWHSATFSWDGKVANFIDESFGDGCPTVTTKTGGLSGGPRVFKTGNMFFFETGSGELLSEYRNPRATNDDTSPTTGKYCSSHLGIPVPAKDRYLLVNAYYRGGSAVIDFSDPTAPKEIAFADLDGTNTWSAYTYPRDPGRHSSIPVYANDGLSRNYGTTENPRFPEAAYGFERFHAKVGPTTLVGFNRLNPQLQERVIPTKIAPPRSSRGKPRTYALGTPAPEGARGPSARPFDK